MLLLPLFFCFAALCLGEAVNLQSLPLVNSTYLVFDSNVSVPGSRKPVTCYRIPMIIQTPRALIAFAEAREGVFGKEYKPSCDDCVVNGIAMRRSTDGGKTWGAYQWAVSDQSTDPSRPNMDIGGNPSAVYDAEAGKVILQFVRGTADNPQGQTCNPATTNWQIESEDDGLTWSAPLEISSYLGKYRGSLVGPSNGIQLRHDGLHKGRLIWCGHWGVYNSTQVWFSDDGGRTYNLSLSVFGKMDECTVAELRDGRVYLNMRNNHINSCKCRAFAISKDGGVNFGNLAFDEALVSPVCQATLSTAGGRLLFANPANNKGKDFAGDRIQGAIKKSLDDGTSWPYKLQITPEGLPADKGGSYDYSCLVPDPLTDDESMGGLLWSHFKAEKQCLVNPAPAACWLVLFTRFILNFGETDEVQLEV